MLSPLNLLSSTIKRCFVHRATNSHLQIILDHTRLRDVSTPVRTLCLTSTFFCLIVASFLSAFYSNEPSVHPVFGRPTFCNMLSINLSFVGVSFYKSLLFQSFLCLSRDSRGDLWTNHTYWFTFLAPRGRAPSLHRARRTSISLEILPSQFSTWKIIFSHFFVASSIFCGGCMCSNGRKTLETVWCRRSQIECA